MAVDEPLLRRELGELVEHRADFVAGQTAIPAMVCGLRKSERRPIIG